jgi:hypothetical protein
MIRRHKLHLLSKLIVTVIFEPVVKNNGISRTRQSRGPVSSSMCVKLVVLILVPHTSFPTPTPVKRPRNRVRLQSSLPPLSVFPYRSLRMWP